MKKNIIVDDILKKYSYPLSRDIKLIMKKSMKETLDKIINQSSDLNEYYGNIKKLREEEKNEFRFDLFDK